MKNLKRCCVAYIRDYLKKDYIKADTCYICSAKEKLQTHHLYSLSQIWTTWCENNNISKITTVEQIKELRHRFKTETEDKLNNKNLITLCELHHRQLHNIYGQVYENRVIPKIKGWLEIRRERNSGII